MGNYRRKIRKKARLKKSSIYNKSLLEELKLLGDNLNGEGISFLTKMSDIEGSLENDVITASLGPLIREAKETKETWISDGAGAIEAIEKAIAQPSNDNIQMDALEQSNIIMATHAAYIEIYTAYTSYLNNLLSNSPEDMKIKGTPND